MSGANVPGPAYSGLTYGPDWLEELPDDRPVAVLLRHAERGFLADGPAGYDVSITEAGRQAAIRLGGRLRGRVHTIRSSPILRCIQTAEALCEGMRNGAEGMTILPDTLLGDPGVFVADAVLAGQTWAQLGNPAMLQALMEGATPLPGLHPPEAAAWRLLQHLLEHSGRVPGLAIFVTHDTVLAPLVARIRGRALSKEHWPGFLDAACVW